MPISRFWRFTVAICSILSGIFVVILVFEAVVARFFPGQASMLFSHIPRLPGKRPVEGGHYASTSPAPIAMPVTDTLLDEPVLPPSTAMSAAHIAKQKLGRRALILVSALLLTALIATSFLFSVRLFTASLGQPADAQINAAQPQLARPVFERGIIYPQWYSDGYGVNDTTWQQTVATVKTQTGAQWIEIPVLFSQATSSSTSIQPSASAPTLQSFSEGIERAHNLGYRVFFVPLMQVRGPGSWSGSITFKTLTQQQAWFDGYWNAILPYVTAAATLLDLRALHSWLRNTTCQPIIILHRHCFSTGKPRSIRWGLRRRPSPRWLSSFFSRAGLASRRCLQPSCYSPPSFSTWQPCSGARYY